ncbi:MAG: hypothetical protein EOP53_12475 [Sphingobacteriales bacterium]|nr:MAG: hypothetical protein EOP53_12475 [Sphingobacteriales bacterium]
MARILYKWFFALFFCLVFTGAARHPIFVSVADVAYNDQTKSLEVSCKLFTDDFEKALRLEYKTHVDLINPTDRPAMDKIVSDYVFKHFTIYLDGKPVAMKYLGFERIEEGIYSYYEVENISIPKTVGFFNTLLYTFHEQQLGLMHVTIKGERKSTKLNNPDSRATINF